MLFLSWISAQYWGVCFGDLRVSNLSPLSAATAAAATAGDDNDDDSTPVIMMPYAEKDVEEALSSAGLRPKGASGNGYKLLQVCVCVCVFACVFVSAFMYCAKDVVSRLSHNT